MDDQALLANIEWYSPKPKAASDKNQTSSPSHDAKDRAGPTEAAACNEHEHLLNDDGDDESNGKRFVDPLYNRDGGELREPFHQMNRINADDDDCDKAAKVINQIWMPIPESYTQYIASQHQGLKTYYINSKKRQDHFAFKLTEERYKTMCQKSTGIVWYRPPPPEEKNNTQTTKRRRAMMSELVVHMSPEQREAAAAIRQADIRFIKRERDIEQQCSETSGLAKVVYKPPEPNELANGTDARRKTLYRRLKAYRIHLQKCHKSKLSIKQREAFMKRIESRKRDASMRSARMDRALRAFRKAKKKDKTLTLNDSYPGKPKQNRSDCPCRGESHGFNTLFRAIRLNGVYCQAYLDCDHLPDKGWGVVRTDLAEERSDEVVLGWGVCKECVSNYKDDLASLTIYLKHSWPKSLNEYCEVLEGVRSKGLSHDIIVKAMNIYMV